MSGFNDSGVDETYSEPSRLLLVVRTSGGERSFMLMAPDSADLGRLLDVAGFDAFAVRLQEATDQSEAYRATSARKRWCATCSSRPRTT